MGTPDSLVRLRVTTTPGEICDTSSVAVGVVADPSGSTSGSGEKSDLSGCDPKSIAASADTLHSNVVRKS